MIAEGLLQANEFIRRIFRHWFIRDFQVFEVKQVFIQPFPIGLPGGIIFLELIILDDTARDRIDQQHLAGAQAILPQDQGFRDIQYADFTGQDHTAIRGDDIPAGTQPVAVQHSAHHVAVAEKNRSGTVPRLQHGGVVLIEIPLLAAHVLVIGPGLGDRDHHGKRKIHAVHDHEFQDIIQHGRIAAILTDDGQDLQHILLQIAAGDGFFPGQHQIHVAADGVDFSVMENKSVGMCSHPAGVRVGGEAAVYHADGRFIIRILQIFVEPTQFPYQKHALIDDRSTGKAGDIGGVALFENTAYHIEAAVESKAAGNILRFFDETLPDAGHTAQGLGSQYFRTDRNLTPAQKLQAFLSSDQFKHLHGLTAGELFLREEEHANAVGAFLSNANARVRAYLGEEAVADLQQNADAVAGLAVGILSRAVFQVFYDVQRVIHGLVAFSSFYIDNCANTTVIVFKTGIIESRGRKGWLVG